MEYTYGFPIPEIKIFTILTHNANLSSYKTAKEEKMRSGYFLLLAAIIVAPLSVIGTRAHCEVPCGIYDDEMRAKLIAEHITTVEKAMKQIVELSAAQPHNYNQIVRWVTNKEHHASEIQHIVTQYFLTQRIKPDAENYGKKLEVLHHMLLGAMQCKQTTDVKNAEALREKLKEFEVLYFGHSHQQ
jgi:nickel superoxide dismutase